MKQLSTIALSTYMTSSEYILSNNEIQVHVPLSGTSTLDQPVRGKYYDFIEV
jgi:hypothetical protein